MLDNLGIAKLQNSSKSLFPMNVFISWSGELSNKVACLLRGWLGNVLQTVKPFVSSEDTLKGANWAKTLSKELGRSRFSIICLTKENIDKSWINFEAGAIANKLQFKNVSALLADLKISDVT